MELDDEEMTDRPQRNRGRRRFVRGLGGAVLVIGLVAIGVAAGVWGERRASSGGSPNPGSASSQVGRGSRDSMGMPAPSVPTAAPAAGPPAEVEVVLTSDAVARAGIKTATVGAGESSASVRVPGSVMPNAYREVKVTPVVGGIVTKVHVALGDTIRRGGPSSRCSAPSWPMRRRSTSPWRPC